MAGLEDLFAGVKGGYEQAGGVTPANLFTGAEPNPAPIPQNVAGGAGGLLGSIFGKATDLAVRTIPEIIKNPASFVNDQGELSLSRVLFPDFRRQKEQEARQAAEQQKAEMSANLIAQGQDILKNAMSLGTPEARAAAAPLLGDPVRARQAIEAANLDQQAATEAATASGANPALAKIANIDLAGKLGATDFAGQKRLEQIGAQGIESRKTQAQGADQDIRAAKARERIKARGERQRSRAFGKAIVPLLDLGSTPTGQTALATNPALRNSIEVARALQATGHLPPGLNEELTKNIIAASKSGATAQGTPEQFGMTSSTQTQIDKDLVAAQDLGMKAETVIATYDPSWSTLGGQAQLKAQGVKDALSGTQSENLANFRAWLQSAGELYSRNKLELTGQASNAQESREIQRVVPDPQALGPTQMKAALESFAANSQRKQAMLSLMKREGRTELTQFEKDYLNMATMRDLRSKGVVSDVAMKNFFGRLTPERRKNVLDRLKMEKANGQ